MLSVDSVLERYKKLAADIGEVVPSSYLTRSTTFRCLLEKYLHKVFQFHWPCNRASDERKILLIPHNFNMTSAEEKVYGNESAFETYQPQPDSLFGELVHVALKIRGDIKLAGSAKKGISVDKSDAAAMVPESLFLFLSLLVGGNDSFSQIEEIVEGKLEVATSVYNRVLSVAQDLIYIANKGRILTPKHTSLGLLLHRRTRQKDLVVQFNKAGHCASYDQVLQLESAMARVTLQSFVPETGKILSYNSVTK